MKFINNNRGFMPEYTISLFLIIIALAVGFAQYQKHGVIGVILGVIITIAGIVAAFFVLAGALDRIGWLDDRLHKKAWYKNTLKISRLALTFIFLSLFAAALLGLATLRFEAIKKIPEPLFLSISFAAGAVATAAGRVLKDIFWPHFWRLCVFLGISIACAFFGMIIGQALFTSLSSQMRVVDIAFIIPLVVYLFMALTGKFKAKKPDEEISR